MWSQIRITYSIKVIPISSTRQYLHEDDDDGTCHDSNIIFTYTSYPRSLAPITTCSDTIVAIIQKLLLQMATPPPPPATPLPPSNYTFTTTSCWVFLHWFLWLLSSQCLDIMEMVIASLWAAISVNPIYTFRFPTILWREEALHNTYVDTVKPRDLEKWVISFTPPYQIFDIENQLII